MAIEFETQVLEADVEEISKKLRALGAEEKDEVLQKRWVFDLKPCTIGSTGEWIRLLQAGDQKPTITYKNKSGKGLAETEEIEVGMNDFEKVAEILKKLPFQGQYYQENRRKKFTYSDIEFTLDTWPKIPTILEVESKSEQKVQEGLKLLELEGKDVGHLGMLTIYDKYGIKIHDFPELKF